MRPDFDATTSAAGRTEVDANDRRDHLLGRDSSDEAEEHIVREIAQRIVLTGEISTRPLDVGSGRRERLRSARVTSLTEFGRAVHAEADAIVSAARVGVSTGHGSRPQA